jgi:hypothetical protein
VTKKAELEGKLCYESMPAVVYNKQRGGRRNDEIIWNMRKMQPIYSKNLGGGKFHEKTGFQILVIL